MMWQCSPKAKKGYEIIRKSWISWYVPVIKVHSCSCLPFQDKWIQYNPQEEGRKEGRKGGREGGRKEGREEGRRKEKGRQGEEGRKEKKEKEERKTFMKPSLPLSQPVWELCTFCEICFYPTENKAFLKKIFWESTGEGQREGERESQASSVPSAQTPIQGLNHDIMTWAKIKSQMLNRLSHPGTPLVLF